MSIVNLGKIGLNVVGIHTQTNTYNRLDVVQDNQTKIWYIARGFDVPANIPLSDVGYWIIFFDGAANDAQIQQNAADLVALEQSTTSALATKSEVGHNHDYVPITDVSISSTINTVVKRDGVGDIYLRLLRPEYTTTNATCNYFMTQVAVGGGTTNNYVRPSTVAQVKTSLGVRSYTYQKRGAFGDARTHYIYPPAGYTMSHLTSVSVWVSSLHMNSTTLNATLDVFYEATRIRIATHAYVLGVGYYTAWEKV